ncbi:hypothetical protein COV17_04035 [Candidatus Woesearchaeota archaeon CG10_big_fil_rev_8_21_14_0_10_36_11]|nr:MAG: hypothetical protein COV17_04035 [Candidatus Woesearchaeota archaeon CG10_big_fil_rev_8_21_14_0_10_36_11]
MDRETLRQMVECYDLILVDTSFFGSGQDARSLPEILYDLKDARELEGAASDIETENIKFQWQLGELTAGNNVFTIPEVQQELSAYLRILRNSYEWHVQNGAGKKPKSHSNKRGGKKYKWRTNRVNKFKDERDEEDIDEIDERNSLGYSSPAARNALGNLNGLIVSVEGATEIQLYEGPRFRVPQRIEGVSEKQYKLIELAIGYSHENPDKSVRVFAQSRGIEKIFAAYLLPQIVRSLQQ